MRPSWTVAPLVLTATLVLAPAAVAQSEPRTAGAGSAALGVGVFGDRPATSLDLGIDFEAGALAFGLGGRVRWLVGEGVRHEEWDERSEIATALRYLSYARAPERGWPGLALAAGSLSGVEIGHGSVIAGYTSGLDVDHRRAGAQARVEGARYRLEGFVDDVVAPRLVAARGQWRLGRFGVALTGAGDLDAGVPMVAADAEVEVAWATPYLDLVAVRDGGAGAHAGVAADLDRLGARWRGRLEGRAGTDGYLPGRVGPLYEVERRALADAARMGGIGGLGALVELGVEVPEVGRLTAGYTRRAGLADQVAVRAVAPHYRGVQAGAWAAADLARGGERALAAEVRAQLPHGLFAVADAARLYRDIDGALEPLWTATVAFGSAVGF